MAEKLLSVIIPVYNAEQNIGNLLKKLEQQKKKDIEVILVDDGSKDNSLKICRSYAADSDCFTVIHQENQGAGAARNQGIEISVGKYIAFIDSDDDISDDFVELICSLCSSTSADIIQLDSCIETSKKILCKRVQLPEGMIAVNEYCKFILQQTTNPPWDKIYRASVICENKVRFHTDMIMGEDLSFTLDFLKRAKNIYVAHKHVYFYRNNTKGLCSNVNLTYFEDLDKLFEHMSDFIIAKGLGEEAKNLMMQSMLRSVVRAIGLCIRNGFSKSEIKIKLETLSNINKLKNGTYINKQDCLRQKLMQFNCYSLISFLVSIKTNYS